MNSVSLIPEKATDLAVQARIYSQSLSQQKNQRTLLEADKLNHIRFIVPIADISF